MPSRFKVSLHAGARAPRHRLPAIADISAPDRPDPAQDALVWPGDPASCRTSLEGLETLKVEDADVSTEDLRAAVVHLEKVRAGCARDTCPPAAYGHADPPAAPPTQLRRSCWHRRGYVAPATAPALSSTQPGWRGWSCPREAPGATLPHLLRLRPPAPAATWPGRQQGAQRPGGQCALESDAAAAACAAHAGAPSTSSS